MHGSLPFCPDTVEPAFEFVLILIDSLSERRRRASDGCETASRFPIKSKKITKPIILLEKFCWTGKRVELEAVVLGEI
jgi:hypothetical protein